MKRHFVVETSEKTNIYSYQSILNSVPSTAEEFLTKIGFSVIANGKYASKYPNMGGVYIGYDNKFWFLDVDSSDIEKYVNIFADEDEYVVKEVMFGEGYDSYNIEEIQNISGLVENISDYWR